MSFVLQALLPVGAVTTYASTVTSAVFTGGVNTVLVGGTLYARQGGAMTLTVNTTSDTECVDIAGAFTGHQLQSTPKSSWSFPTTAPSGDGAQAVTATASVKFNQNNICTGASGSAQGSYTLDNTGPVVTAALTPAPNAAGWNKTDVTVTWTATDTGSGVAAAQPFQTDTVTANGNSIDTAPAQADRLGNTGAAGAVTVRVDKVAPSITSSSSTAINGTMTVIFTCTDTGGSGIKSCTSTTTLQPGQSVTGTAVDNADNSTSTPSITNTFSADTTAPTINHSVSPAPNAAGWNRADATVAFTCADNTGGSGVKSCVADGTSPASASKTISVETTGAAVTGTATDNAGNTATDAVTVKLDKTAPTISASRNPASGNVNGWNDTDVTVSFSCADQSSVQSGIKSCPSSVTLNTDGANQSASGTATDNADNVSAPASVTGISIDKTAPTLSGAPTTQPNANGWYNGNVPIQWTAGDALSGLAGGSPADSTISSEGIGLTANTSVSDKAGNTTSATSNPPVKIDKTAPTTGISGTSNSWTNSTVTVTLAPSDNLSGVASTSYSIDGGPAQTGTSFSLSAEGDHTVTYFSTDNAGNAETAQTAHVKIDKTAPTIAHSFTPLTYTDGAWINQDVTVTFNCADQGGSGLASCTTPVARTTEGEGQQVVGTATDTAGNSATNTAVVSIDKTAPTLSAATDRAANSNGWYSADVTVSFTCGDALSGIASCPVSHTLAEGANQAANGTATDAAGNSKSAGVSGINVDKTAPSLSGAATTAPNGNGWYSGDVTVQWTASDALSGLDGSAPAASTITGEGDTLSASASVSDLAGNSTSKTLGGIKIDRTAPTTTVDVPSALTTGWYNAAVPVTLIASDNLSGVAGTSYSIDGAATQPYTSVFSVGIEGTHSITFWSTDNAGNVEKKAGNSLTLKIDTTAPSLTGAATTAPNANGWYTSDVVIHWTCADATSGLAGACPADSTVTGEGANLGASTSVSDLAGNSTTSKVGPIKIDRTAPTTTAVVPTTPASGWYTSPVQITLTGHDALSGIASTTYTVDGGAAQSSSAAFAFDVEGTHSITFWSTDNAGNVESVGAPLTLQIDHTAPTSTVINPISPDSGWFVTSGIPVAFAAKDNVSGIAATYYTIDGGATQTYGQPFTADLSTGTHTISYWSVDLAGNVEAHGTTNTIAVKVDTIPPTITGAATPGPNSSGWNNSNVDVKFTCTDADSGVNGVAGCVGDTTLTNEGANQTVHGDAIDVAGNRSGTDFGPVNIDKTAPTLMGAAITNPNAIGWYKSNVAIHWTGQDGLSGIDAATQPADSVITGEGSNLGAGPVSISDKAGNSGLASVTGIKIDRTAPTISGATVNDDRTPRNANTAGWFNSALRVHFTCADVLSGVQECASDVVLSTDGAGQSASGTATDNADNSASVTKSGINIDSQPPTTMADLQCTGKNGYCRVNQATVVLSAADQTGLSGVKEIHYSTNGNSWTTAAGASTSVNLTLNGSGKSRVLFFAVDNAGNTESQGGVDVKWDTIAPTVTHTLNPSPNAAGWDKATTTVHFDAIDDSDGSGVDLPTVTPDQTISTETPGQVVSGSAYDLAGNKGTDSVTVKLDKTAPTISGAATMSPNASGWYTSAVTIHFVCADQGAVQSGIATCPADVVLSTDGANQTAAGQAVDKADNTASATVSGINVDSTKPTITNVSVTSGAIYTLGDPAIPTGSPTCTATDGGSGVASCTASLTGGQPNGVGTFSFTATAKDKAGNSASQTGSFKVIYRFDGFLQPINDTAHQTGLTTSIFKGGSTVPAKFQLMKADGTVVQANGLPQWPNPVKGSPMTAPVDESLYTDTATVGSTYRWDTTAQQYVYNWSTKGSTTGYYYRVGITLDDGQTYYVNIGLR